MRVVLGANVVVAAFGARGLCESVFEVCLDRHDILLSELLLAEIRRNLQKKMRLPIFIVEGIESHLRENGVLIVPGNLPPNVCRDPSDIHVLSLATTGNADCIVTGDKDLLIMKYFRNCKILTPRQFSDFIL